MYEEGESGVWILSSLNRLGFSIKSSLGRFFSFVCGIFHHFLLHNSWQLVNNTCEYSDAHALLYKTAEMVKMLKMLSFVWLYYYES